MTIVTRWLALVITLVLPLLCTLAEQRIHRLPPPSFPDIPVLVGVLAPVGLDWRYELSPLEREKIDHGQDREFRSSTGGLTVVRWCNFHGCQLGLFGDAEASLKTGESPGDAPGIGLREEFEMLRPRDGAPVVYLRYSGCFGDESCGWTLRGDIRYAFRYDGARWRPTSERPPDTLWRRTEPLDIVLAGYLGILLAVVSWGAWVMAAHRRRKIDRLATGNPGVDRRARNSNGSRLDIGGAPTSESGSVVVPGTGSAYRDAARIPVEGLVTRRNVSWAEAAQRDVERWEAAILTITCLAAAPLIAILITLP